MKYHLAIEKAQYEVSLYQVQSDFICNFLLIEAYTIFLTVLTSLTIP